MTTLQYKTQVSPEGYVVLPPEYHNRKVVVSVEEEQDGLERESPIKKKRKATAEEVQKFMDTCYGCLEGLSDEEFECLKMERILGK
ncbi:MAG: hypothetical protein FWE67_15505 [Planctomycetaceae bacterium]|nr:hypothetical protein [Planctomycetaceae bacterium]